MTTILPLRKGVLAAALAAACVTGPAFGVERDAAAPAIEATASAGHGQFIIRYRDGAIEGRSQRAMDQHLQSVGRGFGVRPAHVRPMALGAEVFRIDRSLDARQAEAFMAELRRNPAVEWVEVDALMQPTFVPNDPIYSSNQWHYYDTPAGVSLPPAWDISTGTGVVVAVIDTGVADHPDMQTTLVAGYDFISDATRARDGDGRDPDPTDEGDWRTANQCGPGVGAANSSWHGTHVAGTVAADTNNGIGVAGVAFDARVQHLRALGACGGTVSDIADAIIWAAGGDVPGVPENLTPADVINLSLGGSGPCGPTYQAAMDVAHANGAVVVVAAGNSNADVANFRPANCDNVISVGSTTNQAQRSGFSNWGAGIHLSAPGSTIASLGNAGTTVQAAPNYVAKSGTSMAAPHVAGVAALVIAASEDTLTPDEVKRILVNTTKPFAANPNCTWYCGSGILDANAAVRVAAGLDELPDDPPPPPPPPQPPELVVLQNGVPVTGLSTPTFGDRTFSLAVPAGATNLRFQMSGGTGDADLHTRFGAVPTSTVWDCRPYLDGNNETCTVASPQAGTWYAMINTFQPYAGVSLVASYDLVLGPEALAGSSSGMRMRPRHTLTWTGGESAIEVHRNGAVIHAGTNTGTWSGVHNAASGPATYRVCDAGTSDCSNEVTLD